MRQKSIVAFESLCHSEEKLSLKLSSPLSISLKYQLMHGLVKDSRTAELYHRRDSVEGTVFFVFTFSTLSN